MRIAITNPTTWPRVRRGAERFLNELAAYLARRGHDVTVLSSKPGPREATRERGYVTDCHRRLWHPVMGKVGLLEFHVFLATLLPRLLARRFDAVHCCTFADAYAAGLARRFTGTPCVFWINALPPPIRYFRSLTLGGAVFRRAILKADEVISLSRYMHDHFQRTVGRGGMVVPVPVDVDTFKLSRERNLDRPVILCAAALDDDRKGGRVLMRAFNLLKPSLPQAELHVAARVGAERQSLLRSLVSPCWREDVRFLGDGTLEGLPVLFGRSAVSVLPSRWEGFGMVILESMAAGTPVVGTRDGAIPELISNDQVGRLFDPGPTDTPEPVNAEGLAVALRETIGLSRCPETADHCRAHAEQYSWSAVGPTFERLYERLIEERASSRRRLRE
jgi:phosphatidylinositol alpha-mannosyltransferase